MTVILKLNSSILSLMRMLVLLHTFFKKKNDQLTHSEFQNEIHKIGHQYCMLKIILRWFEGKPGGKKPAGHILIHSSHDGLEGLGGLQGCEI